MKLKKPKSHFYSLAIRYTSITIVIFLLFMIFGFTLIQQRKQELDNVELQLLMQTSLLGEKISSKLHTFEMTIALLEQRAITINFENQKERRLFEDSARKQMLLQEGLERICVYDEHVELLYSNYNGSTSDLGIRALIEKNHIMQGKEFSIIAFAENGAKKIVMSKNIYSEYFDSYAILALVIETNKFFDPLIISMMNGIDKAVLYNSEGEIFALWPQIAQNQNPDSSITNISHVSQFSAISQLEVKEFSTKGGVQILSLKDVYIPLSLISDFPFTVALYVDIPTVMKTYDSATYINFVAIFILLIILLFINRRLNHQRNAKETLQQHMVDELSQKVQQRTAELERLSSQDTLTGLMNRRHFNVLVNEEIEKTLFSYAPFSLIAIDLDEFKHINDTFGHVIGDEVLVHTSQLLVKYLGERGHISRWGGDELMILLPNTEGNLAYNIGCELCRIIEQNKYKGEILCTMSMGIAQYKSSEQFVSLVRRADIALYQAKNEGKNKAIRAK